MAKKIPEPIDRAGAILLLSHARDEIKFATEVVDSIFDKGIELCKTLLTISVPVLIASLSVKAEKVAYLNLKVLQTGLSIMTLAAGGLMVILLILRLSIIKRLKLLEGSTARLNLISELLTNWRLEEEAKELNGD